MSAQTGWDGVAHSTYDDSAEEDEQQLEEPEFPDSPGSVTLPAPRDPTAGFKEIGHLAQWKVSSAKPGNGVRELRSENTSEYWQSDGAQPHTITAHFIRRVHIAMVRVYLDFDSDESYTPTKMLVKAGTGYHDLIDVHTATMNSPQGWVELDLQAPAIKCFVLQLVIVANHQNGKDTHVRGLQVFARSSPDDITGDSLALTNSGMLAEMEVR